MIIIIMPNGKKIFQKQLDICSNYKNRYHFKFNGYPKGGIMHEIRKYFKAKHYYQNKARYSPPSSPTFNCTLLKYLPDINHTDITTITVNNRALFQKSLKKQKHIEPKRSYRQNNLLDFILSNQNHLEKVNSKFIDRFMPVPSVQMEDFCLTPQLEDDQIYFQEVPNFKGQFRHLLLLNSFAYWDDVEAELRKNGFHPKGFSVQELVKWDLLRHSSNMRFTTVFNDLFRSINTAGLIGVLNNPNKIPEPYHFSHYYKYLKPKHFHTFSLNWLKNVFNMELLSPELHWEMEFLLRRGRETLQKIKKGIPRTLKHQLRSIIKNFTERALQQ